MPYNVPTVYLRNVNGVIRSWPDALANLIADTGSYALTGQTANMIIGRRLIANVGSFSLAGQNANLVKYPSAPTLSTPTMTSDGASITFSGGSFVSLTPQCKLTSISTWTSIATTSTSPIVYTGLVAGSYDFRVLANGDVNNASNVVSGTTSSSSALHMENFEALTIGTAPSGGTGTFAWGGGKGIVNTTVQNAFAVSGTKSARIRYTGGASGVDAAGQLAFNLGAGFSEVTIAYKWRIPENYVHRNDNPGNNKVFRLWPGGASDGDASYDYGEKVGASMWRGGSDSNSDLICDWDSGTGIGPKGGTYPNFITVAVLQ